MKTLTFFVAILFVSKTESLSCFCGTSPCEFPRCCDTGFYTGDICACCNVCAKGEGDSCGGAWNLEGRCAPGLSCFRGCECKSVDNEDCIFPFIYEGVEHNNCTTENSENGNPWCAVEINADRTVVTNKWKDCTDSCPGMPRDCSEGSLFNLGGICVTKEERERIENIENNGLAFQFDEGESNAENIVETCANPDNEESPSGTTCKCTKTIKLGEEGHCQLPNGSQGGRYSNGWCYLEYVGEPSDPTENCYEDVQWSKGNGRFWSNEACKKYVVDQE